MSSRPGSSRPSLWLLPPGRWAGAADEVTLARARAAQYVKRYFNGLGNAVVGNAVARAGMCRPSQSVQQVGLTGLDRTDRGRRRTPGLRARPVGVLRCPLGPRTSLEKGAQLPVPWRLLPLRSSWLRREGGFVMLSPPVSANASVKRYHAAASRPCGTLAPGPEFGRADLLS